MQKASLVTSDSLLGSSTYEAIKALFRLSKSFEQSFSHVIVQKHIQTPFTTILYPPCLDHIIKSDRHVNILFITFENVDRQKHSQVNFLSKLNRTKTCTDPQHLINPLAFIRYIKNDIGRE